MRIGLIGAGAVAQLHADAASRIPGARLTAVCDLDQAAADRVALPIGAATETDHRRLLDRDDVDAVIVNTPHALHRQMVLDAAARGLHVLVEKPMATTLADIDTMVDTCATAGTTLVVGHIQHFLPEKVAAEKVLESGDLGAVRMVQDHRSTDYRPGTRSPWFFSKRVAGGGALMNIGAHCVDRTVWLSGSRAASLSAATVSRYGVEVETDGTLQLTLESGVTASISVASDTPHYADELLIVCDGGTVVVDPQRGTFVRVDGQTRQVSRARPDDIAEAFHDQLVDFIAAVGGAPPRVSLAHSRHVVDVILTAYRSAAEGQPLSTEH